MESESAFTDKSSGKVYLHLKYVVPPLKLHESYAKGRRMNLDDFKFIYEGLKTGVICHNMQSFLESMRVQTSETIKILTDELEIFKTTGEFTKWDSIGFNLEGVGRQKTISLIEDTITKSKQSRENIDVGLKDIELKVIPKLKDNLENVVTSMTPEVLSKVSLVQYDGLITLNGQVVPKTSLLIEGLSRGFNGFDYSFTSNTILRRFLEFYLDTYDFRSRGFGTTKTTTLEVDDLIIAMDSGMKIVTDLTCPKMVTIRNPSSLLNINLDVTLKNQSLGLGVFGQEIMNVDIPMTTDPISNIKVEVQPSYATVIRRKYWIDECMLILNILLRLILKDNTTKASTSLNIVISLLDERIFIILNEGIVLDHAKIQSFIEEAYKACSAHQPSPEALNLVTKVLGIILSGERNEIKENFSVEVRKILDEVNLTEDM